MSKMHLDEFEIDEPLVRGLLEDQFPQWAELPIERVPSAGTDNALYRLGETMVVRLPRIGWAVDNVEKECHWLPKIAPLLPIAIPTPVEKGIPSEVYPWPWSIYRWIEGRSTVVGDPIDPTELVAFIDALHRIALPDGPSSGRGLPLEAVDQETRRAMGELEGEVDLDQITLMWEAALQAPKWTGPPVWIHGDLSPHNLLIDENCLSAVIDFGSLGVGDPAVDLIIAWNFLPASARESFRTALKVDDATWERGRGWALSIALIALPYYKESNPVLANSARHVIGELAR